MPDSSKVPFSASPRHGASRAPASCAGRIRRGRCRRGLATLFVVLCGLSSTLTAQQAGSKSVSPSASPSGQAALSPAASTVDVKPIARDQEIRKRLQNVLNATDWFTAPKVRVEEGVVFLDGQAPSDEVRKWAGDLARRTQDVVAVVNRMVVPQQSFWDLTPAWKSLAAVGRDFVRSLPLLAVGLLILALSAGFGVLTAKGTREFLRKRIRARILRNVVAAAAGGLVFLLGTYIVLRVSGLTQLALTVVGGTGLVGLAVGIAFRDITENFLASIFLSIQRPFETSDLIEVSGVTGYVQQLNMRTTVLMALDGNLVQIPNASVYKSNLRNFTTNANRREDFVVGIGYDDAIDEAQEIARKVLVDHPAVLNDPEPLVLADSLGKSTVNLRVYFWINGREHSWLKVRSSVIRLVKRAFQKSGISMPDEAREVVFPRGVPVTMVEAKSEKRRDGRKEGPTRDGDAVEKAETVSTKAEAGLKSEADDLEQQAQQARPLPDGENLLATPTGPPRPDGED
ncbi:MAG: mechanosensitive ion channel [Acidobacteriota bacterium]|nr:mechanosensitive ion channel [Acidobacteriota bacterium]